MSIIVLAVDSLTTVVDVFNIGAVARAVSEADALAIADHYGVPCVTYNTGSGWLVLLPGFPGLPWMANSNPTWPSPWDVSLAYSEAAFARLVAHPEFFQRAFTQSLPDEIINAAVDEGNTAIMTT